MKTTRKSSGTLETLLVIGVILIIPLFFVIRTTAEQNAAPNTPAPSLPTVANAPALPTAASTEEDSAMKPQQPPACAFPLAEIKAEESTLEEYAFSEPQVVLTAPEGNPLNVVQWLPDNQQILMTEVLYNQWKGSDPNDIQESISLYDLETDEIKLYAIRSRTGEPPTWLPDKNGVVYSSVTFSNLNPKDGALETHRKLSVSYGDPNAVQLLADNLQLPLVAKPDGSELMYISSKQISKQDKSLKGLSSSASFDPALWDYAKARRNKIPVNYHMAWQPGTSLVFLYSGAGIVSSEGGYTFMLDTATGHICELNFGGWASRAHWSSDGRYLAIVRANSYTGISDAIDSVLLDSITGNLRTVGATIPDAEGEHNAIDFTWTPDNLHLLILQDVPSTYDSHNTETLHHELYLVDLTSDQSVHLFPKFKSFAASGLDNFVWSPDGSELLVRCPIMKFGGGTDRYCLLSVQNSK